MKRLILFAAVMASVVAMAERAIVDGVAWQYFVSGGTAMVGLYDCCSTPVRAVPETTGGAISIPETLGGVAVTSIAQGAFYGNTNITSIAIPPSITTIGPDAFKGCTGLGDGVIYADGCVLTVNGDCPDTVTLPAGTRMIVGGTFSGCTNLTSITLPDGVVRIGESAFYGCSALRTINIPESVIEIGGSAFSGCDKLGEGVVIVDGCVLTVNGDYPSDVVLPNGTRLIAAGAFLNCRQPFTLTIPEGVESIPDYAFPSSMTRLSIPASVRHIGSNAFTSRGISTDSHGLDSIVVAEANTAYKSVDGLLLTKDGKTLLRGVNGAVKIPEGVTNVVAYAFSDCSGLTSVTFPASVMSLEMMWYPIGMINGSLCELVFEGAPPNGSLMVSASPFNKLIVRYDSAYADQWSEMRFGTQVRLPIGDPLPDGGSYREEIDGIVWRFTVTNSVACVGGLNTMAGTMYGLAIPQTTEGEIVVPSTLGGRPVVGIGDYAFDSCSNLTSVTIHCGVTNLGECAFLNCTALENVEILGEVTVSASVWHLGKDAQGMFYYNDSTLLSDVTVNSAQYTWTADAAVRYPHLVWTVKTASGGQTYPHLIATSGPLNDEERALLQRLTNTYCYQSYGKWCTTISTSPFAGCTKVRRATASSSLMPLSVFLPDSYDKVTNITLTSCYQSSVTIGAVGNMKILQLRSVGGLSGCSSLVDVTLPDDTEMIEMSAFSGCGSLKRISFPSGLKVVGNKAFSECRSLESVILPEGVMSVGMNAFSPEMSLDGVSSSLGEVVIPDSVEYLSTVSYSGIMTNTLSCSFRGCASITNVTLPSRYSVYDVFPDSVDKIVKVTIADGSSAIGSRTFDGCDSLTSVTVPASVTSVDSNTFYKKNKLTDVTFLGDAPDFGDDVFYGTPRRMTITTSDEAIGWDDYENWGIPAPWGARTVVAGRSSGDSSSGGGTEPGTAVQTSVVVVSNVVVHYVMNSVSSPMAAPITMDVGIVNVMTEIKGGNVAIPDSWADNYPTFAQKFGSDFAAVLTKPSGKTDAAGNPMLVWQDYVAGTDPTDEDDVFRASVTVVGGKPVVSYTPELSETEKAKRIYTTYGKVSLTDGADWTPVAAGHESDYNFFKVTVEMK